MKLRLGLTAVVLAVSLAALWQARDRGPEVYCQAECTDELGEPLLIYRGLTSHCGSGGSTLRFGDTTTPASAYCVWRATR